MAQIFSKPVPWFMTSRLMISMQTSPATLRLGLTRGATAAVRVRPLPMGVNKKVIGVMKNELRGRIMTEFVALRPKLDIYKTLSENGDKKCKGVKKCIVKKTLDFEDYKQCLLADRNAFGKQLLFQNKVHQKLASIISVALNKGARRQRKDYLIIYSVI